MSDSPRTLADPSVKRSRMSLLNAPHIAPLTEYVLTLRALGHGNVPYFDPLDGGIEAQLLFIQQNPGPKAIQSGFISRDNNDQTAQNSFEIFRETGIPRNFTVLWNIVPWYDSSKPPADRRNVTAHELEIGAQHLQRLLNLLPKLRTIVTVGRHATKTFSRAVASGEIRISAGAKLMSSHHTSQLSLNGAPGRRAQIIEVWKQAYQNARKIS